MIVNKTEKEIKEFFENREFDLTESVRNKPKGTWFAIDDDWIEFCLRDFQSFGITEESWVNYYDISALNLYVIDKPTGHPMQTYMYMMEVVDFQKLKNQGYDGIKYMLGYSHLEEFYGWDVNSVVLWQNQNLVKYIESKKVKDL